MPFQDAVANLAAIAALTTGLADADPFLVGIGMRDALHQPYRAELLPEPRRARGGERRRRIRGVLVRRGTDDARRLR